MISLFIDTSTTNVSISLVKDGKIELNSPAGIAGMHLIGFNENNLLEIIDMSGKNAKEVEEIDSDYVILSEDELEKYILEELKNE